MIISEFIKKVQNLSLKNENIDLNTLLIQEVVNLGINCESEKILEKCRILLTSLENNEYYTISYK